MNDTQAMPASGGRRHKTDNGVIEKDTDRAHYICPMCPGVESDGLDACPKCGMALEPATSPVEERNPELVDMTRRFWLGAVLTIPVLVLAMGSLLPGMGPLLKSALTEGKPRVVTVETEDGIGDDELLALAAALERSSEHPLAAAIVAAARERALDPGQAADFDAPTGMGVTGNVGTRRVAVGNQRLMDELGAPVKTFADRAETLRGKGQTVMFVAVDGYAAGLIGVADPIKQTTPGAIEELRRDGLRIVMLSGDNRTTAEAVAQRLGIDEVHAGVMPRDKGEIVRQLRSDGRVVAMAGDGINDAPALAEADVGIAMGTGTDVAIQSAGVILVKGDLSGIARARLLSRVVMRNIRQNLFLAFVYNSLGVPVAAGVLYPVFGLVQSPIIAAAAMSMSSLSVVSNALRLRMAKI